MMKKALIIGIILFAVGGLIYFISHKASSKAVEVEKSTVNNIEVKKTVSASGTVTAKTEYDLAFEAGGRINTLYVKKGDQVQKGKLLADAVSNSDYSDIQSLRDARDIAITDKEIYIETYKTNTKAVGGVNEYNANLGKFDELISRATANYDSAVSALTNYRILAPIDATVIEVSKEANEVAVASQPVIKLADLGDILFKVAVDQEDFGFVKIGQPVLITLDSYKDTTFSGKISALPLFANSSGDFEVEIALDPAKDGKVLLGMTGDAEIQIDSSQGKVAALSFDAILEDERGKYIWIDKSGVLEKKYIETGLEGDFYTEVKTDLSNVTVVIPTDDVELTEGQTVKYAEGN